jgi:CHAT domain-containing protein/tetratricopeptide (TPR) repeat protein
MLIAPLCLLGSLMVGGEQSRPADVRQRAEEIVAALEAGDLGRLMNLWSSHAPSRDAARQRLSTLMDRRSEWRIALGGMVENPPRGSVCLEVRETGPPQAVLEDYTLLLEEEDGQWRGWELKSDEDARASRLLEAKPPSRARLIAASTGALTRELLHRGAEALSAGEIPRAFETFTIANETAERTNDSATRVEALQALGHIETMRNDPAGASRHFESSLRLAESARDERGQARALEALGNSDRTSGNYTSAERRWTSALEIYQKLHDPSGQALMLNSLGNVRSLVGDYKGSTSRFEESKRIDEELGDTVGVSIALNNLGIDSRLQGKYDEALADFTSALELSRSAGDLSGVAYAFGNMGNVLSAEGNYLEALDAYQRSLASNEKLGNFESVTATLSGIGETYSILGDYPQALAYMERCYALAKKIGYKEGMAIALHNLGDVRSRQGDSRRALQYYEKSLTLDTEMGNPPGMAIDLSDVGQSQAALSDTTAARHSFARALEIARQTKDRETMALVLTNQAVLAGKANECVEGLALAAEAVTIATEIGLRNPLWRAHLTLGQLERQAGRLEEARNEMAIAIGIVEELRRGIPGEEMAEEAFGEMVEPYHEMIGILVEQRDFGEAFEYAERAKGRVLLDVLRQGRRNINGAMTDAERSAEAGRLAQITRWNREVRDKLVSGDPQTEDTAEVSAKLREARLSYEDFLTQLYATHPQLRIARGESSPILWSDLGALLEGEADSLVEFVVTEEVTYLFVITRSAEGRIDLRVHTIRVGKRTLDHDVLRFRRLLADRSLGYSPSARSLYDRLLRPAAAQLEHSRTICIVPDGPLWALPFQALQRSAAHFLVDDAAVFYVPSLTVLREMMARKRPRTGPLRLLAFGNPSIGSELTSGLQRVYRNASLAPIPEAETEVRQIASFYGKGNSVVHVGRDAREDLLKKEAPGFDVLHLATHGILDNQSALYSRLLLATPTTADEDGLLEAREIMQLDLHAGLAVLSACETARGRVGAGEGLIGMSWALFVAGCPTSVVSLWNVSSVSTTRLMIEFHRVLQSTTSRAPTRAGALRSAALVLRRNPRYRHPFYWAAFVVVGDGN